MHAVVHGIAANLIILLLLRFTIFSRASEFPLVIDKGPPALYSQNGLLTSIR